MTTQEKPFYSSRDLAKLLGIRQETARHLLSSNKIPGGFKVGGMWRLGSKDFDQLTRGSR